MTRSSFWECPSRLPFQAKMPEDARGSASFTNRHRGVARWIAYTRIVRINFRHHLPPMSLTFKIVLAAIVGFVVYAAWPPKMSDDQRMELAKQSLKQICSSKGAATTQLSPQALETYCTCASERSVVELGVAGVKRLSTADALTAKDQEIIQLVQGICLERLK
jgi:hypothetical protein